MDVFVKAPLNGSTEKIRTIVRKKATWIIKQQNFFLGFFPKSPPKKYISGESHYYLGRQYKLRVIKAKRNNIHFNAREILVSVKESSSAKTVVNIWYKERAKIKFAEIAEPLIQRFKKYKVEPKSIWQQEMNRRWGSCTPKGKIILNPELIKAPKPCIEYVIIHELCHLVHKNHTKKFFELQVKEMPDWERWKNKLESLLA
ncbi:MAG: M48 family metallopeptidase [Chitinophagaceae bacterium]|nr:M48 family metallopeptidase [Chitinophagaceae bacterium]